MVLTSEPKPAPLASSVSSPFAPSLFTPLFHSLQYLPACAGVRSTHFHSYSHSHLHCLPAAVSQSLTPSLPPLAGTFFLPIAALCHFCTPRLAHSSPANTAPAAVVGPFAMGPVELPPPFHGGLQLHLHSLSLLASDPLLTVLVC